MKLLATFLFVLTVTYVSAQIYIQANGQYSFYKHEHPLAISDVKPNMTVGIGFFIFANQKSKLEVSLEVNSFRRNFYQKYDDLEFKYTFLGIESRLLANYALTEKWKVELGILASVYGPIIKKNGEPLEVGKGFEEFDYGVFFGGHYSLNKSLIFGARLDFWFVEMLTYQLIGNYGELLPEKSDIRVTTAELFIRFQFLNRWK